jgi:hypothetical protein
VSWFPSKYELWLHSDREKVFLGGQQRTQFTKTRFKDHHLFIIIIIIIIDRVGDERKKERKREDKNNETKKKDDEDIYLELMK